ncbi:neurotransmitter:Na+ symporter, NSS family [Thermodesulfobium acidiphilum]|uniref:Neurotransmitter:Na+ symporter, NSS family n=1 Tax=Thermodesulfobium acidiphilum TaxID=1794699 RepID=A0A2R4W2A5_THEAF|nr:sodium-dependent transporter [Thermodesulfobium acidiphilum]AWB10895.1 neurotransmitter:Na+ symporter, NSS family [Thermodesulfobium acidiphilum]PMP85250.1 MAG: transporter [Thermodesulfobium narugense]
MSSGSKKRETFSSGIAVFFAALGSAVGLGNIWKFPYLTGIFGGGAFLLVYILCVIFVGIPVMLAEFFIGRNTRSNVIGAFKKLAPGTMWKHVGTMGVIAAYLIMFFYSCVAGWVYCYLFKSIRGDFVGITLESAKVQFTQTIIGPLTPILWQSIVMVAVGSILIMGVQKGIERVTKTLMPVLFLLIIICDIRALTLPGAFDGVKFLFNVDFSKLTAVAILTALGLSFFKLSLGMGTMVTYSSYFTKDNNLFRTAFSVAFSDTLVSILAGLAIFPTVFAFGMQPGAGPGLLFMTIPLVFSKIPMGNYLLIAFFFLSSIAATTAMLSLVEVLVAYYTEEFGISRKAASIVNSTIIVIIGSTAALSVDANSLLGSIKFFGKGFFDWYDYISSNILLPIGGFFIAIFVGYIMNRKAVLDEFSNNFLKLKFATEIYLFVLKTITPILLIIIFLNSIGIINFK